MDIRILKTFFCLVLLIAFLVMAFITKEVIYSRLAASLGIIMGAYAFQFFSTKTTSTDEKYRNIDNY